MAEELNRDEVAQRLEDIFTASLDGDELEKAISSIPKRMDKFEGRWKGLIGWAEKKYGKLEADASEDSEEEGTQDGDETKEKPTKKRGGLFSRFRGSKEESEISQEETPQEDDDTQEAEEPEEADEEPEEADEEPAKKRGGLFSKLRGSKEESETPQEEIDTHEAEEPIDETAEVPEEEPDVGGHEDSVDSEVSFEVWKGRISSDGGNPEVWRGIASYFASAGRPGRARACEEHADELS
ncbi:MAG: hypothetical protein QF545_03255 [Candidatus Thalassarchaeaceae archaeon]|nr:hypothetical protein [Candidatus Thalassarchaeaceae archaeon]MDP7004568.1 hypothetical protein [Candidatus Thalassarchaeaceae archaeon]